MADIVPVKTWHIYHVGKKARQADRAELMAIAGIDPVDAILQGVDAGGLSWTGMIDNTPCCVFGVCPVGGILPDMGRPWLVGTNLIDEHSVSFLRRNKPYIKKMLAKYSYLSNYVDVRNVRAIQWLKWMGFQFKEPSLFGIAQIPFMQFEMRA